MRFYNRSIDGFLTDHLGYSVYNYQLCDNIDFDFNNRAMFQIKVKANSDFFNSKNKILLGKGFKLIGVNINFEFIPSMNITTEKVDVDYLEVAQKYTDDILRIASISFIHNRYYSDPFITKSQADFIMERWAYNCLYENRADHVFLNFHKSELAGFLSARVEEDIAAIDLLAVDEKFRGRRYASKLVEQFFLKYAWQNDKIKKLQVGTQITNLIAIKTYQNMGFKIRGFDYVYHLHTGV